MIVRYSRKSDEEEIKDLLYKSFGEMVEIEGAYEGIDKGRYLCAVIYGEIAAITGICFDDEFSGYQLTWSCTKPEYRRKGIMSKLIERLIAVTDEDIYCSCWRIGDNKNINLYMPMKKNHFEKIISNTLTHNVNHNCDSKKDCPYRTKSCFCANDLYLRKGIVE